VASEKLAAISAQAKEFAGFAEDLARSALRNLQGELRRLEDMLRDAEKETREKTVLRRQQCQEVVNRLNHAIAHFDRALITLLRRDLEETELEPLSRLFNFDLLEQIVGNGGTSVHSRRKLAQMLRLVAQRVVDGVYSDENISVQLPAPRRSLSELENVISLRERLQEEEASLQKWVAVLEAIEQRESVQLELNTKRQQLEGKKDAGGREIEEGLAKQLFRFEEYQKKRHEEPGLKAELKRISDGISAEGSQIDKLSQELREARERESSVKAEIKKEQDDFAAQVTAFGECLPADFPEIAALTETKFSDDFAVCVREYLKIQQEMRDLNAEIESALQRLEMALGPDYAGSDEFETIQHFREELEALPEREEVLRRDWQHQLTGLQATFDQILRSLADIKSAADRLNRDFSTIQVSNLAALKMEVLEATEIVGSIRRLARIEQPGLFDESTGFESTIASFRSRFEATPVLRYQDLFTLQFTVTGDDGKPHHYQDFRQVESHGTTITIKVLFNLLMLRSLLREDSQKNLLCEIPFFLDEIHSLDAVNRHAILATARKLGFIAITAAPESVSEVDALYFLQPQRGRIVVKNSHRVSILARQRGA
jgi:tetratricopeptide (TPR) repeat protein